MNKKASEVKVGDIISVREGLIRVETMSRTKLIGEYLACHANLVAMVANLQEFIDSMPAPNDDNEIPESINWAVLGDYKHLEATMIEASRIADEISS